MGPLKGKEFGKSILEKYGWKEGKGLGRCEDGITKPIRPKLKFDTRGVGDDPAQEFKDRWWQNQYDEIVSSLQVAVTEDGVQVKCDRDADQNGGPSRCRYGRKDRQPFVKASTLHPSDNRSHRRHYPSPASPTTSEASDARQPVAEETSSWLQVHGDDNSSTGASTKQVLSDEQLFEACGGRTVHKGARHGLSLSGKLARIREQEEKMMAQLAASSTPPNAKKVKRKEPSSP